MGQRLHAPQWPDVDERQQEIVAAFQFLNVPAYPPGGIEDSVSAAQPALPSKVRCAGFTQQAVRKGTLGAVPQNTIVSAQIGSVSSTPAREHRPPTVPRKPSTESIRTCTAGSTHPESLADAMIAAAGKGCIGQSPLLGYTPMSAQRSRSPANSQIPAGSPGSHIETSEAPRTA